MQKTSGISLPVTVHNIGFCTADSAHISVSSVGADETRVLMAEGGVGRIPVDSLRATVLALPSEGLNGLTTLEINVAPPPGTRDLLTENNTVRIKLIFTSVREPLQAIDTGVCRWRTAHGWRLRWRKPNLTVRLADVSGGSSGGAGGVVCGQDGCPPIVRFAGVRRQCCDTRA